MKISDHLKHCQERVDSKLDSILTQAANPAPKLIQAMRYSVLNPGKRIRPMLVYACCELLNGKIANADPAACAVELIHCYSLIHDDLPAMDDDDLRRGLPTCHKEFDEATAILAGDALQALAFATLADPTLLPGSRPSAVTRLLQVPVLATAAGERGMVAGQAIDLAATGQHITMAELEVMHQHKTGALITASVQLGLMAAGCNDQTQFAKLQRYSNAVGLAFQVQDDILDVTADTQILGKRQGADQQLNKPTYVSLLGLDGARQRASELCSEAYDAINSFGEKGQRLRDLASYIVERDH